jgi:hypothetical protein
MLGITRNFDPIIRGRLRLPTRKAADRMWVFGLPLISRNDYPAFSPIRVRAAACSCTCSAEIFPVTCGVAALDPYPFAYECPIRSARWRLARMRRPSDAGSRRHITIRGQYKGRTGGRDHQSLENTRWSDGENKRTPLNGQRNGHPL